MRALIFTALVFFGALIGGIFGFWGFVIGAVIGGYAASGLAPSSSSSKGEVFLRVAFQASGKVAQADGQVTEQEIRCAETVMEQMGMDAEQRTHALHYFDLGTRPGFDLEESLHEVMESFGREYPMIATFVEIQVAMACADGTLSDSERRIIQVCCEILGFRRDDLQDIINHHLQGGRSEESSAYAAEGDVDWACALLEIDRAAPMEDIQRAYARKIKDFHPDKLASKGLPKELMDFATDRAKQITKAYRTIKQAKSRGA